MARQFRKQIDVPGDQKVFRDNGDRIAELGEHFKTPARQLQFSLRGLVAIGHAAHGDDLRPPLWRRQFVAQELRRVLLHHDFGFEIQAGGKAQILVERPGVAVNTAMLATPVRIHARFKSDVGTVIAGDDRAGAVLEELRARQRIFLGIPIRVAFEMNRFEPVGRVHRRAAGGEGCATVRHCGGAYARIRKRRMPR